MNSNNIINNNNNNSNSNSNSNSNNSNISNSNNSSNNNLTANNSTDLRTGRICEIQKNSFFIRYEGQEIPGKLKGTFYNEGAAIPVVGDNVEFILNNAGDSTITRILERKSILTRPDQSGHAIGYVKNMMIQCMVANIDYAFIVTSLNKNYNVSRIARYVSTVLQGGAVPVVILTKSDLCNNPGRYISEIEDLSDEVRVHAISALYQIGLEELKPYLTPGVTIALIGSSGVGKSTLVNAIAGKEIMKTSDIREDDSKGRHTTTHRQMIFMEDDITFIDTPGMREIGLCDVSEGIDTTFSDIVELASGCRFCDCRHESEPGCAIKAALEAGTLSRDRYELYKRLQSENMSSSELRARKETLMVYVAKTRKERNKRSKQ